MRTFVSAFHLLLLACATTFQAVAFEETRTEQVMNGIVQRLYAALPVEELYALDYPRALELLTAEDKAQLAEVHWSFEVDQPVVVSVLRHIDQAVAPYWLAEKGFQKTALKAKNMEGWEYEVWQKEFPAGKVALGINGLDGHRPHYLVCVGPVEGGGRPVLSNFYPEWQQVVEMKAGAMTYHDWTELVLTEVPEALQGQQLLPTKRGRGTEAALVGGFRQTPYPSSRTPQPVFLTWKGDSRTTQTFNWRTSTEVTTGMVIVKPADGGGEPQYFEATLTKMQDRMLANDQFCHWYTATAERLKPGIRYEYVLGSDAEGGWTAPQEFSTAPESAEAPFSFFFCSDVHSNPEYGAMLEANAQRNPQAAFTVISGDLVKTGRERQDWDLLLSYGEPVFKRTPVMPSIGNHDAQLGFPPEMYLEIFTLPENGPKELTPERCYTFQYANTQFFMLDVMDETAPQAAWLEEQLKKSTATWKVAVFHFPLYSEDEPYPHLEKAWGTLFDRYHVDLVLTGHTHRYLRTWPMKAGKRVASAADGTVYVTTISIPTRGSERPTPEFAEVILNRGVLAGLFSVEAGKLKYEAVTKEGEVLDTFEIVK